MVSAEGWDDEKCILEYHSYSFHLWVGILLKDRAQFCALADTTSVEMLLFNLKASVSLGTFCGQLLFGLGVALPEGLSKWNNSIHWCQLHMKETWITSSLISYVFNA